ncbi:amino acid ABC transporter substrate-binding protein, PAAT family [Candidatus Vecturithrix granuli]|uniref:Amino acid ABC transporter substrate-binding protein, PAAT family n=1 Tax=Vecturithrix granuli TaxID=1499967 RepID=A0A081C1B6_VECG1|nr:amino acid ABC transporter substrate-binding protein, PAAT family [Candidatus Vecturithrix granuli]
MRTCMCAMILLLLATGVFGEEITILGNDYSPPKIFMDGETPAGILTDIVKYLDQQMPDYTFKIELYPWVRAYENAVEGKGGIIGLSMTEERLKIFDYSEPVYYDEVAIVVLKGQEFPFETIEDLQGKTIGIGRGGSFGEEYEKAKQAGLFKIEEDNGPVMRLRKLLAKRMDCAFINPGEVALHYTVKQDEELLRHKEEFVVLPTPFKRDPNFLGFSKKMGMANFLQAFNAELKKAYESGAIQKIIDQYSN